MKPHFNEYYQCSSQGYIKYQNVPINNLQVVKQIPIASKCNQILPYKLHKLQVKQPLIMSSAKQLSIKATQPPVQITVKQQKKQNSMNYSFSTSLMQNPILKMLQKDEVHSIHLDDKIKNRIKNNQKSVDLAKSTYTNVRKHFPDMKRSLFSTNNTYSTQLTKDNSQKNTERLEMIVDQLKNEKQKRQEFEKKYEILLNLVNRVQKANTMISELDKQQKNSKFQNSKQDLPKQKLKKKHKNHYVKSNSQSQDLSDEQRPIVIDYKRSRRKGSSPSPIIINFGSQVLHNSPSLKKSKFIGPQNEEQNISQIKSNLNQIKQQVQILHENVDYLQKKIDQQQIKHQKDLLIRQLQDKERKIEEMIKENKQIKQINQLLTNRTIQSQTLNNTFWGIKIQKNVITFSFFFSFLIILLILAFKSAIC